MALTDRNMAAWVNVLNSRKDDPALRGNATQLIADGEVSPQTVGLAGLMGRNASNVSDTAFNRSIGKNQGRKEQAQGASSDTFASKQTQMVDPRVLKAATEYAESNLVEEKKSLAAQKGMLSKLMKIEENVPFSSRIDLTGPMATFRELYGVDLSKGYKGPNSTLLPQIMQGQRMYDKSLGEYQGKKIKFMNQALKDKLDLKNLSKIGYGRTFTEGTQGNKSELALARMNNALASLKLRESEANRRDEKHATDNALKMNKLGNFSVASDAVTNLSVVKRFIDEAQDRFKETGDLDIAGLGLAESNLYGQASGKRNFMGQTAMGIGSVGEFFGVPGGKSLRTRMTEGAILNRSVADLVATIRKIYSGTASSDKEAIGIANILGDTQGASEEEFIDAYNKFISKFVRDFESRMAVIQSDPGLSKAYENLDHTKIVQAAEFERLFVKKYGDKDVKLYGAPIKQEKEEIPSGDVLDGLDFGG